MKGLRIEPKGDALLVSITCDCGNTCLTNEEGGEREFKHEVKPGGSEKDKILICKCEKKFRLHSQTRHIHVFED